MNLKTVTASLSVASLVLFSLPAVTLADEATNNTTGANSSNNASITQSTSFSFDVSNNATTRNSIDITANTGDNSASNNTGNGTVQSGSADIAAAATTTANPGAGSITLPAMPHDSSVTASNTRTGANSTNTADVTVDHTANVDIRNSSTANNSASIDVNTGDNRADNNTGNGLVRSGDVRVRVSFNTVANAGGVTRTAPGGGAGGGGTTPTGAGGGTTTATTTTITPTPSPSPTTTAAISGAGETRATTVVHPRGGVGGGFVPAGGNWLTIATLLFLLSFGILYADKLTALLARRFPWEEQVLRA